jgi:hypothetical protein
MLVHGLLQITEFQGVSSGFLFAGQHRLVLSWCRIQNDSCHVHFVNVCFCGLEWVSCDARLLKELSRIVVFILISFISCLSSAPVTVSSTACFFMSNALTSHTGLSSWPSFRDGLDDHVCLAIKSHREVSTLRFLAAATFSKAVVSSRDMSSSCTGSSGIFKALTNL